MSPTWVPLVAGALFSVSSDAGDLAVHPVSAQEAIQTAQQRVVKLYGGSLGREHGYGSGVLVSPDGRVVTTLSVLLETPALRAVLPDGRRLPAKVIYRSEPLQLALLKIDVSDVPAFELGDSTRLRPGEWLIAAANAFRVASGPEPVSISLGVFSGRTRLDARRQTQAFAYEEQVLLTDTIVSSPGSAGGALVDRDGRLVGVIGKPVISRRTNTWLNYAIPIEQVRAMLAQADQPELPATARRPRTDEAGLTLVDLGIRLFDVGGRVRLAYVERIRPESRARRAGLRVGDLILTVNGRPVETCDEVVDALAAIAVEEPVELLVKRGDEVVVVELVPRGAPQ
jgi:serine protease Do